MNLKEIQLVVYSFYVIMIAVIFIPLVSPYTAQKSYGFISMSVLGENGSTDEYYGNNTGAIKVGVTNRWTIRVTNKLEEVAYITLKVKIVGQGSSLPDTIQFTPSNAPTEYQISRILLNHEKVEMPFEWQITSLSDEANIESLMINGEPVYPSTNLGEDMSCKLVFELWMYNPSTGEMTFKIGQGVTSTCVWNQIDFKVVS